MSRSEARARGLGVALVATLALAFGARAESVGSYLGVYAQSNSNVLEAENVYAGITVTRVVENSPAEAAGLEVGDVLLEANEIALDTPARLEDLAEALPPGSIVKLAVERDRRLLELELRSVARVSKPETASASAGAAAGLGELRVERRRLGFELRPARPERLRELGLSPRLGVEVRALAERSPLLDQGVGPGDILTEVDGRPIPSCDALIEFLDGLDERETLDLLVYDAEDGQRREVRVPLYRPARALTRLSIPLLLSIERGRDTSEYSALLGAFRWTRLVNGSRLRLLWLLRLETGSPDELLDVGSGS